MKKILYIIVVLTISSCNSSKLFTEYELYRRDKYFDYPKEKLTIKLFNDTTGLFVNSDKGRESFIQEFTFSKIKSDYLIVEDLNIQNSHFISLNKGDTIILEKRRLHFIYNGDKKYFLSFKRK
jgi:hypothetical protein